MLLLMFIRSKARASYLDIRNAEHMDEKKKVLKHIRVLCKWKWKKNVKNTKKNYDDGKHEIIKSRVVAIISDKVKTN